ncbi:MAG: HAD-IC family P-type ATPase [Myxococcales bacterium]|nr:HAD-IC family P-type ATPase [Myxococcales bacterium]
MTVTEIYLPGPYRDGAAGVSTDAADARDEIDAADASATPDASAPPGSPPPSRPSPPSPPSPPVGRTLRVTGVGYAPLGQISSGSQVLTSSDGVAPARVEPALAADLRMLLVAGVLCNDAELLASDAPTPVFTPVGDPTEVALLVLAQKAGLSPSALRAEHARRAEIPFDSATKMMATAHRTAGGYLVIVKGAPELVLDLCGAARVGGSERPLDGDARHAAMAAAEHMANQALRVLAIGVLELPERSEPPALDAAVGFGALRGKLSLLGLLGQIDPPRQEVKDAVARCRVAGIRPVMVTGDHKTTAHAIARELGISGSSAREVVDGRELAAMDDAALAARIEEVSVFARVHPAQKLRIVAAYQARGHVVAMTGDGVNDAPALAKADVGVAMGGSGTEVAKEASKIVIGDDNFATIVAAVEEGRVVYRNIKKAVLLLFSTSAAEVAVLLLALMLGYPPPLAAVQILWNNLVTEGLITVNLAMEPPEGDEMSAQPIAHDEPLLSRALLWRMAFIVPAIVISTLGWYVVRTESGISPEQVRTETFTLLAICEWFNVLNCRTETRSALNLGVLRNRWLLAGLVVGNLLQVAVVFWAPLSRVFRTAPFGLEVVIALGVVGSLVLWVEEARKLVVRRRAARRAGYNRQR